MNQSVGGTDLKFSSTRQYVIAPSPYTGPTEVSLMMKPNGGAVAQGFIFQTQNREAESEFFWGKKI